MPGPSMFAIVAEIPFSIQELYCPKEKETSKFQNLRSRHSIYSFLKEISCIYIIAHIEILYYIHLGILVQLLQRRIQDIPLNIYYNSFSTIIQIEIVFLIQ